MTSMIRLGPEETQTAAPEPPTPVTSDSSVPDAPDDTVEVEEETAAEEVNAIDSTFRKYSHPLTFSACCMYPRKTHSCYCCQR